MKILKFTALPFVAIALAFSACQESTTSQFEEHLTNNDTEILQYLEDNNIKNDRLAKGLYIEKVVEVDTVGMSSDEKEKITLENNEKIGIFYKITSLSGTLAGENLDENGNLPTTVERISSSSSNIVPTAVARAIEEMKFVGDEVNIYAASYYGYNDSDWTLEAKDADDGKAHRVAPGQTILANVKVEARYSDDQLEEFEKTSIEKYIKDEKLDKYDVKELPTGERIVTIEKGTGERPKTSEYVAMTYAGTLLDGAKFDASAKENDEGVVEENPFVFILGAGQVIKGWDECISQMTVGDSSVLIIPSSQAYGGARDKDGNQNSRIGPYILPEIMRKDLMNKGDITKLPPDAVLVFHVKFLGNRDDALKYRD
ncbi:FKBP-type peptidyl-prolyl cis-trans isomerase [Fulvitalea axinellae]